MWEEISKFSCDKSSFFLTALGQPKFQQPSVYSHVVLLINFPEQLELYFYFIPINIREAIKFYNLGNKIFETDFRSYCVTFRD